MTARQADDRCGCIDRDVGLGQRSDILSRIRGASFDLRLLCWFQQFLRQLSYCEPISDIRTDNFTHGRLEKNGIMPGRG
jgi:hypothetical protein